MDRMNEQTYINYPGRCENPYVNNFFVGSKPELLKEQGRTGFRRNLLNYPWDVDASSGEIIVSERDNHRIQIFDAFGNETRFNPYGVKGHGPNNLLYPCGVASTRNSEAKVVAVDSGNRRVVFMNIRNDQQGYGYLNHVRDFGHLNFTCPMGICYDPTSDNLCVTDVGLQKATLHLWTGVKVGELRTQQGDPLLHPGAVARDEKGRYFVSDANAHNIQVFSPSGAFIHRFGCLGDKEGQFNKPWGITFDKDGYLLVADEANSRIQMFAPDCRYVSTIAQNIYLPKGVSINAHGNLVVTTGDPYNFLKIIKYK